MQRGQKLPLSKLCAADWSLGWWESVQHTNTQTKGDMLEKAHSHGEQQHRSIASHEGSRGFPNSINSFMYRTDCIFIVLAYRKTNIGYLLLLFLASRLSPDESNFAWDCCKRDMCVLWTVDWTKRDFWRHHHGLQESVMALPDFFSNQESSIIPWEMCVNVRKCLIWQLWRKWDNIPGWVSLSISSKKLIGSILGRDPFYPNFGRTRFCSSCMILLMNQLANRWVKTIMSWQR